MVFSLRIRYGHLRRTRLGKSSTKHVLVYISVLFSKHAKIIEWSYNYKRVQPSQLATVIFPTLPRWTVSYKLTLIFLMPRWKLPSGPGGGYRTAFCTCLPGQREVEAPWESLWLCTTSREGLIRPTQPAQTNQSLRPTNRGLWANNYEDFTYVIFGQLWIYVCVWVGMCTHACVHMCVYTSIFLKLEITECLLTLAPIK